jgi:reactive intermediate/imine deaminase
MDLHCHWRNVVEKQIISTPKVAIPTAPFSMATKTGAMLFVAGIVALDASGRLVGQGDIKAQTRQVLENIKELVLAGGGSLSDVTKTTVYLTDFENYAEMNEVYREYFAEVPPARATVKVELVDSRFLVEIDAIAVVS